MANGDKASAVGWVLAAGTDDLRTGYDKINYALDRAAEQYTTLRDTVLPAINQPAFAVRRSTAAIELQSGQYRAVPAGWWGGPTFNTGFTSWSNGQLKIAKAGVYRIVAHMNATTDHAQVETQVVRNTTDPNTANTLVKNSGGPRGVLATDLVRLVAGDVLTVLVYLRGGDTHVIENNPYDLTFSVEWVRA